MILLLMLEWLRLDLGLRGVMNHRSLNHRSLNRLNGYTILVHNWSWSIIALQDMFNLLLLIFLILFSPWNFNLYNSLPNYLPFPWRSLEWHYNSGRSRHYHGCSGIDEWWRHIFVISWDSWLLVMYRLLIERSLVIPKDQMVQIVSNSIEGLVIDFVVISSILVLRFRVEENELLQTVLGLFEMLESVDVLFPIGLVLWIVELVKVIINKTVKVPPELA